MNYNFIPEQSFKYLKQYDVWGNIPQDKSVFFGIIATFTDALKKSLNNRESVFVFDCKSFPNWNSQMLARKIYNHFYKLYCSEAVFCGGSEYPFLKEKECYELLLPSDDDECNFYYKDFKAVRGVISVEIEYMEKHPKLIPDFLG